jgi:hypothetical protein
LLVFLSGEYAPGPGFLLLIVYARGPVIVISALPCPKKKPFIVFYGEENSVRMVYELGGGLLGKLIKRFYTL